jgi:iron-sulfur cluster repair protein YtfE (RIC family)
MRDYEECRPYIEHVLAEHRRLHQMLGSMRQAIVHSVGPDGDASFAEVTRILRRLRDELSHHFAEEDAGGCMDEAVCRCPRLAGEEKRIAAEHPAILAQLDRLIEGTTKSPANLRNQMALQHQFKDLCEQLYAHERAENHLLQEGFGATVNGDEVGQLSMPQFPHG